MKKKLKRIFLQLLFLCTVLLPFTLNNIHIYGKENNDDKQITIYAYDSNGEKLGCITGEISFDSKLMIENDPSKLGYAEISKNYLDSANVIFTFGVNIDGKYTGPVDLTFFLGNQYDDMKAKIVSQNNISANDIARYDENTTTVHDGKVNININYTDLYKRTPFLIGLYTAAETTPTEPSQSNIMMKNMVLTDPKIALVELNGTFSTDSKVSIQSLDKDDSICKNILKNKKDTFIKGYHIDLISGQHEGGINIKVSLGKDYAKHDVRVYQKLKNGSIKKVETVASVDGKINFESDDLSPFLITEKNSPVKKDKVNFSQHELFISVAIVIVLLGCALFILTSKHKRKIK